MHNEGMKKRYSKRDVDKDVKDQKMNAEDEVIDRVKKEILDRLLEIDKLQKALTGRRITDYQEGSLIDKQELFPDGKKVLNIGDPWQVLDKENVVNLEYELGDEASFIYDKEYFLESLKNDYPSQIKRFISGLKITERGSDFAKRIERKLSVIDSYIRIGISESDFDRLAEMFRDLILTVESLNSDNPTIKHYLKEFWYLFINTARGLEDIYYMNTVIQPIIDSEVIKRKGITKDDEDKIIKGLVEDFRGKKKYKNAELVKGIFPDTPFPDNTFDRIVASWSFSVYMFQNMEKRDFPVVWNELDRLLKKNGVAYMWPLDWAKNGYGMVDSLFDYCKSGGMVGYIEDYYSPDIHWLDVENDYPGSVAEDLCNAQTLIVVAKGSDRLTRYQVEGSLIKSADEVYQEQDVA